jgi:tRNA threonylcarbamoyladenosine biosynthesis protein TsaE
MQPMGQMDPKEPRRLVSSSPEQTTGLGELLGTLLRAGDVVLLTGDLGAGKTQFTKGVAHALGIDEAITSPTFNLMHEHSGARGVTFRHFDLYRLDDSAQLDDIDYFGLLEDDAISVVEWGDRFSDALPLDYLLVAFGLLDEQTREMRLEASGARSASLLEEYWEACREVASDG